MSRNTICGNNANNLRIRIGTTRALLSTQCYEGSRVPVWSREQRVISPLLLHVSSLQISPPTSQATPLSEHYFYPPSTAPTTNYYKEN